MTDMDQLDENLRAMPKLSNFRGRLSEIPFDFHELIGALAPRRILIVAPKKDHNFQVASVERIVSSARNVFQLHGSSHQLSVEYPDGGHDFAEPMRRQAYDLLKTT